MIQRKAYKYVLVPDGFGPKSGALFLALKRVPIPGFPVRFLPTRSQLPPMHEKTEELGTR
jgi:hypothetical protein